MRRMMILNLIVFFLSMGVCFSHSFATENSLEFSIKGVQWLNGGKLIHFDGEKDQKNITGKLYPKLNNDKSPGDGAVLFCFYDSKDKLVLVKQKFVTENPKQEPLFHFNFNLDNDDLKGDFKIKVVAQHSVWGWLNY